MDALTAPPETAEQEFERLSAQLHALTVRSEELQKRVAKIRLDPQSGSGVELEKLKIEHAAVGIDIQRLLPRWSELKISLKR